MSGGEGWDQPRWQGVRSHSLTRNSEWKLTTNPSDVASKHYHREGSSDNSYPERAYEDLVNKRGKCLLPATNQAGEVVAVKDPFNRVQRFWLILAQCGRFKDIAVVTHSKLMYDCQLLPGFSRKLGRAGAVRGIASLPPRGAREASTGSCTEPKTRQLRYDDARPHYHPCSCESAWLAAASPVETHRPAAAGRRLH